MMTLRWFRIGEPARGAPAGRRRSAIRPAGLLLVALAALGQGGCAWIGCGPCGFLRTRIFHRAAPVSNCCGPAAEIPPIEYGGPPTLISPGPPGGIVPAIPVSPSELEPISSETSRRSNTGTALGRATSSTNRPAYRTTSRGENFASALVPSEPAARPAPRAVAPSSPPPRASASASNHPLDNLPPLTLPVDPRRDRDEATSTASVPGVPPSAEDLLGSLPEPPSEIAQPLRADAIPQPRFEIAPAPAPGPVGSAGEPAGPGLTVVPGIRSFEVVEPELAGGSQPTTTGLQWLAEKGYRTLLDLREPGPDQPAFIAEATRLGFRYLPLPTSAETIDADLVRRFHAELDQIEARPLFFFDSGGDRAGALWYIRRLSLDSVKVDEKTASREAKSLGLDDQKFWLAAAAYLDSLVHARPPDEAGPAPQPIPTTTPEALKPPAGAVASALGIDPGGLSLAQTFGDRLPGTPTPDAPRDPTAWKQYAALIVTSLGVPLAYFGRSALSLGASVRASLPAPARPPRSLPGGSDA